jgi:hypothetical protein
MFDALDIFITKFGCESFFMLASIFLLTEKLINVASSEIDLCESAKTVSLRVKHAKIVTL